MELPWKLRIEKKFLKGFSNGEKKLLYSLKNEKIQAVLAEYGTSGAESLKVIKYLNLPLVVHFHGFDASIKYIIEAHKGSYLEMFKYASSVIAVSFKMKNDLIKMGCSEEKIFLNPYGPHERFFDCHPDYHSQVFLSIGRFVEKKAPHLALLAFQKLLTTYPAARLRMIGEGPLLPVCQEIAKALGIQSQVDFLGVQPPEVVKKEMEHAIAFVQHSITAADGDAEGTPVAVLEAQAAALPVIATYHAGIPDVVIHQKTGLLCEERNVEMMAKNMKQLLQDNTLAETLGQAGRERVKTHFTMEMHLRVLTEAVEKAMGGRS